MHCNWILAAVLCALIVQLDAKGRKKGEGKGSAGEGHQRNAESAESGIGGGFGEKGDVAAVVIVSDPSDGKDGKGGSQPNFPFISDPISQSPNDSPVLTSGTPSIACSDSSRPQNLTSGSGLISSQNYPNSYLNYANCAYLLDGHDEVVTLQFRDFCTEQSFDFVRIYDGSGDTSPLIAQISGCAPTPKIVYTSTQRYMYVKFTADVSVTFRGFSAAYYTGPPMYTCSISAAAYSASGAAVCNNPSTGYVRLNGVEVFTAGWCNSSLVNKRGINTVLVNPVTCTSNDIRQFNTGLYTASSNDLVDYINSLSPGSILVGVTGDEPTQSMNDALLRRLRSAGVYVDDVLFRGNFAFAIKIGSPDTTVYRRSINNAVTTYLTVIAAGTTTDNTVIV